MHARLDESSATNKSARMQKLIFLFVFLPLTALAAGDLPNFRQSAEGIYRGGRPTSDGLRHLQKMGVRTIISLQGGDMQFSDPAVVDFFKWWEPGERPENIAAEKRNSEALGMSFVNAPLNSIQPVSAAADRMIDEILELMNDPNNQPLYIHCEHGRDRTGLLIALYQVKYLNAEVESAHKAWADSGHDNLHAFFTGNLDDYYFAKSAQIVALRDSLRPRTAAAGD